MPPVRTLLTLAAAIALAALATWIIAVLPWYRGLPLTAAQRALLTGAIVGVLALLIGWLLIILPAYWD